METPEIHILSKIDWQFFGTLTFKSERLPERVRLALYFALLRRVAAEFRVHFPRLLWCLRQEQGEQFGRRHFHYLLAGLPASGVSKTTCFFQMSIWEKLGGGMARVSEFDPRLNGEAYILKCLGCADPGDFYESAKFGGHCQLMLLDSVYRVARTSRWMGERRLAHRQKATESTPG
jgi:hypothetical protein